jgi:hypothetical protein
MHRSLAIRAPQVIVEDYDKCFEGTLTEAELHAKEGALENLHDLVDLIDNAQGMLSSYVVVPACACSVYSFHGGQEEYPFLVGQTSMTW